MFMRMHACVCVSFCAHMKVCICFRLCAATFLGSAGGAASLASVFGASSASLSGWKYSRRIADIRVFEFVSLSSNHAIDCVASFVSESIDWHFSDRPTKPIGISHLLFKTPQQPQPPLHLAIGVSGWLRNVDDATKPWVCACVHVYMIAYHCVYAHVCVSLRLRLHVRVLCVFVCVWMLCVACVYVSVPCRHS